MQSDERRNQVETQFANVRVLMGTWLARRDMGAFTSTSECNMVRAK